MSDAKKQPYDTSLKGLLREQTAEMLPHLLAGAEFLSELPTEVFKPQPPLRADQVYIIRYRGTRHILHTELETSSNSKMPYRMLSYHSLLLEEHELPIISLIIYPFRTTIPEPPLIEKSGEEVLVHFKYKVLPLWTLNAREYVKEHILSMYPLLPTMEGANATLLIQAINEMKDVYTEDQLMRRLFWLRTLLRRATILSTSEKEPVERKINMFDKLLEEDPYIQEQREIATVEALQKAVVLVVKRRFPSLEETAQQTIKRIEEVPALELLITQVSGAPDENFARTLLYTSAA